MTDIFTQEKRSEIMRAIKNKDSKIETEFRKCLWTKGIRYRKNCNNYFGKPDIILKKYKIVVFIDSCFWHGCKDHCRLPSTNKDYWNKKIKNNKIRDNKVTSYYIEKNWKVLRFWEHDIKKNKDDCINNILQIKNQ